MKKIVLLLCSVTLFADGPFDTPEPKSFDLSMFNTVERALNKKAAKSPKISCRYVCDKKLYREQVISEAISFYKENNDYFKKSR